MNSKTFLGAAFCLASVAAVYYQNATRPLPAVQTPAVEAAAPQKKLACSSEINAKLEEHLIYRIEGDYMVYVQPVWYVMAIDEKRAAAAYIAECKLKGSARFLDGRSGKLLARWGTNGFVTY